MPDWPDAACRNDPLDRWFPSTDARVVVDELRAVCGGCPMRRDCADYALEHGLDYGVWGGTSPVDRRSILRGRATVETVWHRFDARHAQLTLTV